MAESELIGVASEDASHYSAKKDVLLVEFGERAAPGSKLNDAIQQAEREFSKVDSLLVPDMPALTRLLEEREEGSVGMVVLINPTDAEALMKLPGLYPDMVFSIIDAPLPSYALNAQNVQFREDEGAFLLGAIAAIRTDQRITFMALEENERSKEMQKSFTSGVHHVRKSSVVRSMLNVRPSATQTTRLATTVSSAFQDGSAIIFSMDNDIIEQALRAAKAERRIVISGDAPSSGMDTSRLMTYMVKRYDLALMDVLRIYTHRQWHSGIILLGVSGGYVDYSLNAENVEIFPKDSIDQIEGIKDYIGQGIVSKDP